MKNAILIHGTCDKEEYFSDEYPSLSNSHWFPWLQKQLLKEGISTATPDMLDAYLPDYEHWNKEFERYDITEDTILVGHSCGGGFLVRWLSENKDKKVGKVVLVAPWLDPNNRKDKGFFDFEIDPEITSRTKGLTVFSSTDDFDEVQSSIKTIVEAVKNIKVVDFDNYGHFCYRDLKKDSFPELLEEVLL